MKNLVLIGFMGTGKSVVGRALAARLDRPFVDVDEAIEREQGRPIRKIFAEQGEPAFRAVERAMIQRVTQRDGQVIAAGGGAIMDEGNLAALSRRGWLVWLTAEPDVILQRIGDPATRPLLNTADPRARVAELLALRQATYAKADAVVETSRRTVEQVVHEIIRIGEKAW
ncbi:MAG: hypothetical protein A3C53_03430 [Omnitrophica WOR_2 bacterium RIFCSPHIGHO2_02_FULL_68_15]|nr:MAG: hypothetical protein A3C53_03430 [Omnitrophica WOR_2 bacterium RIFCSPHIGHO2_02_FULL_68_15]